MKQKCECLRGFKYKLQIMGVACEGPAFMHGDNHSALRNITVPESTLKKKCQIIAYHLVRKEFHGMNVEWSMLTLTKMNQIS